MAQKFSVFCDCCGKELTQQTSYPHRYGLRLESVDYKPPSSDGIVFAIAMYPPLPQPAHFCGLGCLAEWIERQGKPPSQDCLTGPGNGDSL